MSTKTMSNGVADSSSNSYKAVASQDENHAPQSGLAQFSEDVYARLSDALEKTKAELGEVQAKLRAFDDRMQASSSVRRGGERASEFLRRGLEDARAALDDLAEASRGVLDASTEIPMKAIAKSLAALNKAVDVLRDLAKQYDDKYQISAKVSDIVNPARARAAKYISDISELLTSLSSATFAQLKGVNDGLLARLKSVTDSSLSYLINTAASLDNKYDIESKITTTAKQLDEKYKLVERVKEIDEKYKIQEKTEGLLEKAKVKGKELDERLTDGKAAGIIEDAYSTGLKMVTEGLGKLQKDFEVARRNSRENVNGQ